MFALVSEDFGGNWPWLAFIYVEGKFFVHMGDCMCILVCGVKAFLWQFSRLRLHGFFQD